jgi:hypothetical protein
MKWLLRGMVDTMSRHGLGGTWLSSFGEGQCAEAIPFKRVLSHQSELLFWAI